MKLRIRDANSGQVLSGRILQSDYCARYYNPAIGRFISEDPTGLAAGPNEYAYAGDDPFDFTDPFGLDKKPSPQACYGGFAQPDGSCLLPNAPSNVQTQIQQYHDCLDKINKTPDGKLYKALSPLQMIPGWGLTPKESQVDNALEVGGKFAAFGFFKSVSNSSFFG